MIPRPAGHGHDDVHDDGLNPAAADGEDDAHALTAHHYQRPARSRVEYSLTPPGRSLSGRIAATAPRWAGAVEAYR